MTRFYKLKQFRIEEFVIFSEEPGNPATGERSLRMSIAPESVPGFAHNEAPIPDSSDFTVLSSDRARSRSPEIKNLPKQLLWVRSRRFTSFAEKGAYDFRFRTT